MRRAKIVCTLGPATNSERRIRELVYAGMDVARLNMSHGTHQEHAEVYRLVRAAADASGHGVGIFADLQGPKVRVGDLDSPRMLVEGDTVFLSGEGAGAPGDLPVMPAVLTEVLQPGHEILIDDGLVRMTVQETDGARLRALVMVGGAVGSHKGVNVPGVPVPVPSVTEKDLADLEYALSLGTTVAFAALMLGVACWLFRRRDW